METRAMNVVLLPDAEVSERFRDISAMIARRTPTEINLNTPDMIPHMSLYNSAFPIDAFEAVRDELRHVIENEEPFDVSVDTASMYATYAFADARITTELRNLHERIIQLLNPLRKGAMPQLPPGFTPAQVQHVTEFGMLLAGPAFQPHVTVGHVTNHAAHADVIRMIGDELPLTFRADAIHLVETGPYGTCKKIITSFPFNG